MQDSALLLIEFQGEWLNEDGKLTGLFLDKNQFATSVVNAKKVIESTRKTSMEVVHSGLSYTENYHELGKAKHGLRAAIPAYKTFMAGTEGSQFISPFIPGNNEFSVQGRIGSNAFTGSNLDSYLRNNHIHTLYIMGYALHVCVESTMRAAHDFGYEVVIIEDACSAFNEEQKNYFMKHVLHHFGSSINTNGYIKLLNNVSIEK